MAESEGRRSAAVGVVEVLGMLDAAAVVNAMFKASAVDHLRSLRVGSGWIAIWIGGDLNAVNTAIDAAYDALDGSREARSVVFTLPSDAIRQYIMTPVAA